MHNEGQIWREVKSKLILMHGSVTNAAVAFKCHPNSLRAAAVGKCPRIQFKLQKKIWEFDQKKRPALVLMNK